MNSELQLVRELNSHEFSLTTRYALNHGSYRSATRFTWSFPVAGNLRGYVETFNGYGKS